MPQISMEGLSRTQKFRLITGCVAPRPIALITTLNGDGSCNAAPFSAFNYMSDDPPVIAVGFDRYGAESAGRAGEMKDTQRNIMERDSFVVNMVDEALLRAAVACGADFAAGVSEPETVGLALSPSHGIPVPRLRDTPVALECRRLSITTLGPARDLMLGIVTSIYCRPGLLDEATLKIHADQYFPVGRIGGPVYVSTRTQIKVG